MRFLEQEKLDLGIRQKVGSKTRFRPNNREEKELRGENGAFDTETSGFGGDVRERSARKRPKSGKWAENFGGSVVLRDVKRRNFGGSEIGVAELRSRRYMDRLKGNGETESF